MFGSKRREAKRAAAARAAAQLESVLSPNREAVLDAWFGRDPGVFGPPSPNRDGGDAPASFADAVPPAEQTPPAAATDPTVPTAALRPSSERSVGLASEPSSAAAASPSVLDEGANPASPDLADPHDELALAGAPSFPPDVLPRIEQALIAIAAHARRLDARLDALERRLDTGLDALDQVATRADVADLRERTDALGERIDEAAVVLREELTAAAAERPVPTGHLVEPLFTPIPLPPRQGNGRL